MTHHWEEGEGEECGGGAEGIDEGESNWGQEMDACQVEQAKDWDAKDNSWDGKDDGDLLG